MNTQQTFIHGPGKPMIHAKPATLSLNKSEDAPSANPRKTKSSRNGNIETAKVGDQDRPEDLCPNLPEAISVDQAFRDNLAMVIPSLRAFARGLCGRKDVADALAQDAIICGWAARSNFAPGVNSRAWMFKGLRDRFHSQFRTDTHFVDSDSAKHERGRIVDSSQRCEADTPGILLALQILPAEQREVLLLIEAAGFSAEEAAYIIGCSGGGLKRRLACARVAITVIISGQARQIQMHKAA